MNINVSPEVAARLKAKVEAGDYASEAELIQAALDALENRDKDIDSWLREEVAGAYDAYIANPENVVPAERVFAEAATRYHARKSHEGK